MMTIENVARAVLFTSILSLVSGQTCNYWYSAPYQCANQFPETSCSQDGWHCIFGYKTFYNTSYNAYVLDSQGAYASAKNHLLTSGYTSCRAQSDCSDINVDKISSWRSFTCDGANSCRNSNIEVGTSIGCFGDQSCAYGNIWPRGDGDSGTKSISAWGAYSLMNKVINSTNSENMV